MLSRSNPISSKPNPLFDPLLDKASRTVFTTALSLFLCAFGITAHAATSAGTLQYSATTYSTAYNVAAVVVTLDRIGGTTGAVRVGLNTRAGTALNGLDFVGVNQWVNWAAGDGAPKTVSIKLLNRGSYSGSRSFSLGLSGQSGASLGSPATAVVNISGTAMNAAGTLQYSASTYSTAYNVAAVVVTLDRVGGTTGAVRVGLNTHPGTALSGLDFVGVNQWVNWAAGDGAAKTVSIKLINRGAYKGSRSFSLGLSGESGASLGSPATATVNISGTAMNGNPSAGTLELSATSYTALQSAKSISIGIGRTAGSTGAVTVKYNTTNGTALAGTSYTSTSGTLSWASGDTSARTVVVPLLATTGYSGTKSLTFALSSPSVATLGNPGSAAVNITGTGTIATCGETSSSYVTTGDWDAKQYGNYVVNNNNWGGTLGQRLWANSAGCWGVTDTATVDTDTPHSYPSVTRGWSQNGGVMQALSTPGTNDWTTKSGMGIPVTALTKAKIHWTFQAPTASGPRWMGLQDIYFHTEATPPYVDFPPFIDLLIDQAIGDQVVNSSTYYALVSQGAHATTITISGNTYVIYVDLPGGLAYHQPGGHEVHLFNLPTAFTSGNANPQWGVRDDVKDLAPIVKYLMQSHPLDDAGKPLLNAAGAEITTPLITPNLFLTAINSGWEIDTGTSFTTTGFCVAMQNEPDCP
jgi:hypothetical protein